MTFQARGHRWCLHLFIALAASCWLAPSLGSNLCADDFFRLTQFSRGDNNGDSRYNIGDPLFTLNFLFVPDSDRPTCLEALDANDDDSLDISDPVYELTNLFGTGDPPPAPGPGECGVDLSVGYMGCDQYDFCPDDTALIVHALNRVTYGPTEDLLTKIQTRDDLVEYITSQLDDAPDNYDQRMEPELDTQIEALNLGFVEAFSTPGRQTERLKSTLVLNAALSRWQLLHVVTQFFNNHFHSDLTAVRDQFFRRGGRGGQSNRGDAAVFAVVDTDLSGGIDEVEWEAYRALHSPLRPWTSFSRRIRDDNVSPGIITADEFDNVVIAYWKYGRGTDQRGIAAEQELREYTVYRRLAFGAFKGMLEACAKSVAMTIYLNNFENIASEPNENYAREYFELQSQGADRVYTQIDIQEAARVFTGWSVGWVQQSAIADDDYNHMNNPSATVFPINRRVSNQRPFNYPDTAFWDDSTYTWAFVLNPNNHDFGTKVLFDPLYGGVDSFGNPLSGAALTITPSGNAVTDAMQEFDLLLDRTVAFRDVAKFISTKLIQLLVTDDLSDLPKTLPLSPVMQALFDAVDTDGSGSIDFDEWEMPIPLVLPNGRPIAVFNELDVSGDGLITELEYQEPDLLGAAIDTWQAEDGNIREVLRTILMSDEFLSLDFAQSKVKTPFESVVSAMRALDSAPDLLSTSGFLGDQQLGGVLATAVELVGAGMELWDFSDPTGESEFGFDWMHTVGLLERLKYLNRATNPQDLNTDFRFFYDPFIRQTDWGLTDAELSVDFFSLLFLGGDLLSEQRTLAIDAYDNPTAGSLTEVTSAIAFLLSLPQFQKQ